MKTWYILTGLVVVVVCAGIFLLGEVYVAWRSVRDHRPTVQDESQDQRNQAIREAYGPGAEAGDRREATSNPALREAAESYFPLTPCSNLTKLG